jgi:hypothetical protein
MPKLTKYEYETKTNITTPQRNYIIWYDYTHGNSSKEELADEHDLEVDTIRKIINKIEKETKEYFY